MFFDETRLTSRGLGRQWYAGLFAWSLPVICAAAWMATPAQAQEQSRKQGKAEAATGQANINSASDDPGPIPQTVENLPELIPVTRVTPEYPYLAQVTGAAGTVEIVATVAPNGHVIGVQVIRGFPMLQHAAASAVLQWVYAPQPAQTRTIAYVTFFSDEMPKSPGSIQPAQLISRKEPVYPEQAPDGREGSGPTGRHHRHGRPREIRSHREGRSVVSECRAGGCTAMDL